MTPDDQFAESDPPQSDDNRLGRPDTVCDQAEETWRMARATAGSRAQFFGRIVAATSFLIFPDSEDLALTLAFAKPPPTPH